MKETKSQLDFVRGWIALIDKLIKVANPLRFVIEPLQGRPVNQHSRLFHDEWAVQKKERLLRHGGGVTLGRRNIWVGEIEGPEQSKQVVAIDDSIDRAAIGVRLLARCPALEQIDRTTPEGRVEIARDKQQRIPHRFEVEPQRTVRFRQQIRLSGSAALVAKVVVRSLSPVGQTLESINN